MKAFLLVALFVLCHSAFSQDERYYRRIFTEELVKKPQEVIDYKIQVKSPDYKLDLNQDHFAETIRIEKKDGLDFFTVLDQFGQKVFEKKLDSIGRESKLFKIQLKTISKDTNALILHFYEGKIDSTRFESTARIFFISYPKSDFKKMSFYKGPHFFHEKEKVSEQYWTRRYTVNTIDYNNDGVKEISVNYNKISRIYFFLGEGVWKRL